MSGKKYLYHLHSQKLLVASQSDLKICMNVNKGAFISGEIHQANVPSLGLYHQSPSVNNNPCTNYLIAYLFPMIGIVVLFDLTRAKLLLESGLCRGVQHFLPDNSPISLSTTCYKLVEGT